MPEKDTTILIRKKKIQKRSFIYAVLLFSPALLALGAIMVLSLTHQVVEIAPEGVMLSPAKDSSSMILFLAIYTIYHLIFVGILYKHFLKKHIQKLISKEFHKVNQVRLKHK